MGDVYHGTAFEIKFQEGQSKAPLKVQLLKVGEFHDARYGVVEITSRTLSQLKENFDKRVRKIDVAIDYSHKSEDVAAGWVKGVSLSDDGMELWADVTWTPNGAKRLADKEFRYLSADFNFNYQDNETQEKFGPVLMGAGLTNRPVVKGMAPAVELHEINKKFADVLNHKFPIDTAENTKKSKDEFKQLADKFYQKADLKRIVYDRIVLAEINHGVRPLFSKDDRFDKLLSEDIKKQIQKGETKMDEKMLLAEIGDLKAENARLSDTLVKFKELELSPDELKKKLAKMTEENQKLSDKLAKLEEAKKLAEKETAFSTLLSEGKAVPAQKEAYIAGDMEKFIELSEEINTEAVGHGGEGDAAKKKDGEKDVHDEVMELAEKEAKDKGIELADAVSVVLGRDEKLNKRYEDSVAL